MVALHADCLILINITTARNAPLWRETASRFMTGGLTGVTTCGTVKDGFYFRQGEIMEQMYNDVYNDESCLTDNTVMYCYQPPCDHSDPPSDPPCQHEKIKYCPKCGVCYCEDCRQEWAPTLSYTYTTGRTNAV